MRRRTETVWVAGPSALLLLLSVWIRPGLAADQSPQDLLDRAVAATPDVAHGGALFKHYCERCHDDRGSGGGDREFPQLAGQQRQYLLTQLVQIITLDRFAPKMHRVLARDALAEPQALSDLTAYLAAQPHDSHGEHGDGSRLGLGRALYDQRCAQCHGALGSGQTPGPIPAIAGQNYTYLVRQLKGFAAGHRSKAEPAVIDAVSKLSADDISAVADFMSRLPESASP
jgi:cytochrome c553